MVCRTRESCRMVLETSSIRVNGEHKRVEKGLTVERLVESMGITKAAVERNAQPLTDLSQCVEDGDDYDIFEQL